MTKERNIFEILSILDRRNKPMTSKEITGELNDLGIPLTSRMIRHYLQQLDNEGFTENLGRTGRRIMDDGRDELRRSFVYARSDYILTKIWRVISDANFDINKQRGEVPVSLSFIKESQEQKVRKILEEICQTKLFTQLMKIAHSGEKLCGRDIPKGMIGLAIPSSVIIDEIILKNGVCISPSALCCIIEFVDQRPVKCTNFSTITDVSYDPMELWINHKVGRVYDAAVKNHGEIFVEYTDFPYTARTKVIRLLEKAVGLFGGTIMVGGSEEKTFGVPTQSGNTGLFIVSGESIPCALEEKGIKTNTETIASAINFKELEPIAPVKGDVLLL